MLTILFADRWRWCRDRYHSTEHNVSPPHKRRSSPPTKNLSNKMKTTSGAIDHKLFYINFCFFVKFLIFFGSTVYSNIIYIVFVFCKFCVLKNH